MQHDTKASERQRRSGGTIASPNGNAIVECYEDMLLTRCLNDKNGDAIARYENVLTKLVSPTKRKISAAILALHFDGQSTNFVAVERYLNGRGELAEVGKSTLPQLGAGIVFDDMSCDGARDAVLDAYRERESTRVLQDGAAGNISATDARKKLNEILAESATNLPAIQDAAEVIEQKIIVPDDVIEGVAHRGGKVACGGASKSNKTWLLTDLAVSVATGTEWLGFPTREGRVLYVNFELPAAFFAKRIQTICDEGQIKLKPKMLCVLNLRGHVADWARLCQQIPAGEFVLIILDPCYKLLLGRDENKAGDIASLMDEFEVLAVKTGAAVAFGAHYSKGNQAAKESIDRVGGSGVFARDPDSIINFTKHEQPDCFTVEMTLRNHPPQKPFVVKWEFPLFTVDATLDPSKLKRVGRPEKYTVQDLLELIDKPMRATQIVKIAKEERGIPERRVYELLREAKGAESLRQPKPRGAYEKV
jgi:hypothetical protein